MVDMATLNGRRYRSNAPGEDPSPVYLVIDSQRRWIVDQAIYDGLFPDTDGIYSETFLEDIPRGPDIDDAVLGRIADDDPNVYLGIDGRRRLVPNIATRDRYHFRGDVGPSARIATLIDGAPVP
ncbi:hypothetical protein ABTY61_13255 [Kitasatospora sp. NPDC096128]|uniref:hypothetical protein n=1 Tax=Kitasatospora sp. NPDC096128 TaxID=3155547 RepID=UPI0033208B16